MSVPSVRISERSERASRRTRAGGAAKGRPPHPLASVPRDRLELARLVLDLELDSERAIRPDLLTAERLAAQHQLDLVGIRVDVNSDGCPFVAIPAPRRHDIGPRPRARVDDDPTMVLRPLHGDVRLGPEPEHDLAVVRLRSSVPRDVDVAAPGGEPRIAPGQRPHRGLVALRAVLHATDARLAEVVPPGPREVTDDVVVRDHPGPAGVHPRGIGLGGEDDPIGIGLGVSREALVHVVVASQVEMPEHLDRLGSDDRREHRLVHEVGEVHRRGVDAGLRIRVGDGERLSQLCEHLRAADEEAVHRVRDEPGVVEAAHLVGERAAETYAGGRGAIRDLVADAVDHDARVVQILADHRLDIGLPPRCEP